MEIKITGEPKEIADIVAATTKSAKIKNILDKQLELLSKASKIAVDDKELVKNLPAISHAISEICLFQCKLQPEKEQILNILKRTIVQSLQKASCDNAEDSSVLNRVMTGRVRNSKIADCIKEILEMEKGK